MKWNLLAVSPQEFSLENTLFIGQVFSWRKHNDEYLGCIGRALVRMKQTSEGILWKTEGSGDVMSYFNMQVNVSSLYSEWSSDAFFSEVCDFKPGVRIIKQPIFECVISFICSQNNHIKRITKNIETIRNDYGSFMFRRFDRDWFSFPTPEELAKASEDDLRNMGLGYRAKYIVSSTEYVISKGGEKWLEELRELPYEEVKEELIQLAGVGPKVADCICLFAYNFLHVVPIDVHMWKIASKHYLRRERENLNGRTYREAAQAFENKFGRYAGWAHSVLYAGSIASFNFKGNKSQGINKRK